MLGDMYREQRPPHPVAGVPGAVVWTRTPAAAPTAYRVLPDGCMDLIWRDGLLIAGPDTRAQLGTDGPGTAYTGLRLPPGLGRGVFGVPADELRDQRVALDAVWCPAEVRELTERIAAAPDRGAALAEVAAARLRRAGWGGTARATGPGGGSGPDPEMLRRLVLAGIRQGHGVAEIARTAGLGERQLHRRCRELFGYGAKTLARVLRMRYALRLHGAGVPPARTAARAGYADQAHLSREIRALAGVPLGALGPARTARPARAAAEAAQAAVPEASGAKRSTVLPSGSTTTA
jgi:AraC-like DNA-binding protein